MTLLCQLDVRAVSMHGLVLYVAVFYITLPTMSPCTVVSGLCVCRVLQLDVAECVKLIGILNFCPLHAYYLDGPVLVLKHSI